MHRSPSKEAYQRVQGVLDKAGVQLRSTQRRLFAERLFRIARLVINQETMASLPRRRPVKRGKGRPRGQTINQLFGALVGFWFDLTNEIPGVSYVPSNRINVKAGKHQGRFVNFVQAFCAEMVADLERCNDRKLNRLLVELRGIVTNSSRVRRRLQAIGVPQFKTRVNDW